MNLELEEDLLAACQQLLMVLALLVATAALVGSAVFNAPPSPDLKPVSPPAYGTQLA